MTGPIAIRSFPGTCKAKLIFPFSSLVQHPTACKVTKQGGGTGMKIKNVCLAGFFLVMMLNLFWSVGTAGAYGEPEGSEMHINTVYVGNEATDLIVAIDGSFSPDVAYTISVTLARDGDEIARWDFVASGAEANQPFTHHDQGLEPGQTYAYTPRADVSWVDPGSNKPQTYTVTAWGAKDTKITAGEVRGRITRDTIWNGGTWSLVDELHVDEHATLTIESATIVHGGDIYVRGGLVAEGVLFNTGSTIRIHGSMGADSEPDEAYASASVVVKNSTINSDYFSLFSQNTPVFQGNTGSGEEVGITFRHLHESGLEEITDNHLPAGNLEIYSPLPVSLTIKKNTFADIKVKGGKNLILEDNFVENIEVSGGHEGSGLALPSLNDGAVEISNNTVSGRIWVKGLGSSDLMITANKFEHTTYVYGTSIMLSHFENNLSSENRRVVDNKGLMGILMGEDSVGGDVSHVLVEGNEIDYEAVSQNRYEGIDVNNGSHNVIIDNIITGPGKLGIDLGVLTKFGTVSYNEIIGNTITGWDYGIGLGSAQNNIVQGNTLKTNHHSNIHIPGTAYPREDTGYPSANRIYNNRFDLPSSPYAKQVITKEPHLSHQNYWTQEQTPGTNIVGGPFIGGNYWSDYSGADADGDGIGDTSYVIDEKNIDELPLMAPVLTLTTAPGNPDNLEVTVAPEQEKRVPVIEIALSVSQDAPESLSIDSLQFDFTAVGVNPEAIDKVYLVERDPQNYVSPVSVIGQKAGAQQMTFDGLNRVLAPGETRQYILEYLIEKTDPACTTYGAGITPAQVESTFVSSGQHVAAMGWAVNGTVFRKGIAPVIQVAPSGAGAVTLVPEKQCYSWDDQITFTFTPVDGYGFLYYQDVNTLLRDDNPLTLPMTWDEALDYAGTAYFKEVVPPPADGRKHLGLEDPVHTGTGEFYFDRPLLNLGGPLPLSVGLYYGSNVARRIKSNDLDLAFGHILGPMWLHDFQLLRLYKGDQKTHIIYDRGKILRFHQQENGWELTGGDDVRYELKTDTGGNYYLLDPDKARVFVFDPDRRLARVEDRNGNRHQLRYDEDGNLASVEDGLGRILHFAYDGTQLVRIHDGQGRAFRFGYTGNLLTSITDPMGRITTYTYDPDQNGFITGITYPVGNTPNTQIYDNQGRVVSQTDAAGNSTGLTFDKDGSTRIACPDNTTLAHRHDHLYQLSGYTDPRGQKVTIDYDPAGGHHVMTDRAGDQTKVGIHKESGQRAWLTNALGETTTYTYAAREQAFGDGVNFTFYDLARITHPDGTVDQFAHDRKGNVIERTDRAGNIWKYSYNSMGQVLSAINPAGGVVTHSYNEDGTKASKTDSDTGPTTYEYDDYKRRIKIIHPDGAFIEMTYDFNDRLTALTDENGHTYGYGYDANGNLITVTDPKDRQIAYAYDQMDRVEKITDRLNQTTLVAYDPMGRMASVTDPNNVVVAYGYDSRGWRNLTTMGGNVWQTEYDDEGVVASITTPLGNTTVYESDRLGFPVSITNPLGQTEVFSRDPMNRISQTTDPLGRATAYAYDDRGVLSGVTTPGTGTAIYQRNGLGLLSQITDLNGNKWNFGYSQMGRPVWKTDPLSRRTDYSYDTRGRLSQMSYPDGSSLNIAYDGAGNVVERRYSGDLVFSYAYDEMNRLIAADGFSLERDAEGRVTATDSTGTRFKTSYDPGGRIAALGYDNDSFSVTYTYDETTGLLSKVTDDLTGVHMDFVYDADQRLTGINRSNTINSTYAYDEAGRLVTIAHGMDIDLQYILDGAGGISSVDMRVPVQADSLLADGKDVFTYNKALQMVDVGYRYDINGRLTASPDTTLTWDSASMLTGIGGVNFTYNGAGDLVSRTDGRTTTTYYYNHALDLNPVVAEKDDITGKFLRYYVWTPDGSLLYMIDAADGNKVYFYHFDRTGSTLALTDESGRITDSYAYTPYGRLLKHVGPSLQPFTFVGAWGVRQEGASGTVYQMRTRYYDALSGRFLSQEPLWPQLLDPKALNPYQYAGADPVRLIDPVGTNAKDTVIGTKIAFAEKYADPLINWFLEDFHINQRSKLRESLEKFGKKWGWSRERIDAHVKRELSQMPFDIFWFQKGVHLYKGDPMFLDAVLINENEEFEGDFQGPGAWFADINGQNIQLGQGKSLRLDPNKVDVLRNMSGHNLIQVRFEVNYHYKDADYTREQISKFVSTVPVTLSDLTRQTAGR